MAEKGGTWTFKLQVDLPVSGHDSSASSFNQVDTAFSTFLMPEKQESLSNVEIFISCDGATLYEAQTSGIEEANNCAEDSDNCADGGVHE